MSWDVDVVVGIQNKELIWKMIQTDLTDWRIWSEDEGDSNLWFHMLKLIMCKIKIIICAKSHEISEYGKYFKFKLFKSI
jgi:hypothetical protein